MQLLPGRFDPASPRFDRNASTLAIFLDEVEALAASHSQTPQQTIRAAIRYSPDDVYELWSGIPEALGEDWQAYKAALHRLYPGSDGARRYSIRHLEQLVERQECSLIENQDEFGSYYRSFTVVSDYLLKKDKLSRREASSFFLSGFHIEFRNQIRQQLRAENPRRYHDDFFTVEEIRDVAVFLLGGERHSTNHLTINKPVHNQLSPSVASNVPDTSHTLPPSIPSHPSNFLHEPQATVVIESEPSPSPVSTITEATSTHSATSTTDLFAETMPVDPHRQKLHTDEVTIDQAQVNSLLISNYQLSYEEQRAVANEIQKLLQMSAAVSPAALATNFEHETIPFAPAVIPEATITSAIASSDFVKPQSSTPSKENDAIVNSAQPGRLLPSNGANSHSANDIFASIDTGVQESKPILSIFTNSPDFNKDSRPVVHTQPEQLEQCHTADLISQNHSDSTTTPEKTTIGSKSAQRNAIQGHSSRDELSQHPAHNTTVPYAETMPAVVTTGLAVIANVLLASFWIVFAYVIMISSGIVSITPSRLPSIMTSASLDTIVSSVKSALHKSIFSAKTSFQHPPSTKEVTSIDSQPNLLNHPARTLFLEQPCTSVVSRVLCRLHSLLKHPIDVSKEPQTDQLNTQLGSARKRQQPRKEAKPAAHTEERPFIAPASEDATNF